MYWLWHLLAHVTGLDDMSGPWYGFWSGFGSDLSEAAILLVVFRKVKCHASGCPRVGIHRVSGTHYVTCARHHPVHRGGRAATAEQIEAEHRMSTPV